MNDNFNYEDGTPSPEFLIKSIAEQGYSLETSLADLIDNSVSANADKVEILVDTSSIPFTLFIADNGEGMSEEALIKNMKFPSQSPEIVRSKNDLGRFGLGMKTASFSQTRRFTVISRLKGRSNYSGRTWDVNYLRKDGWRIIVNTESEIQTIISKYLELSNNHLKAFENFKPNTIIVWEGLYKYEEYLKKENRTRALQKEITEITTEYLSLVFHRFMERKKNPLSIRINNNQVNSFNPFPEGETDLRQIEPRQAQFRSDVIKMEGFILPSRSILESQKGLSKWTTKSKGLMDMEGLYIYRSDRIILFGGWNGIIKKTPRLQLARLRVEVGNSVDHLLHLNVSKSQIVIPHELRIAFENYIEDLKVEAEREFYNKGIRKFSKKNTQSHTQLFSRNYSNKGSLLEINSDFPILKSLVETLNKQQNSQLALILRMLSVRINKIRKVYEDKIFIGVEEKDGIGLEDLESTISTLLESGISSDMIKQDILPNLGYKYFSLPTEIKEKLQ